MLSSSGDAADIGRAYDAGANAYHVKPAGFDDLLRLVEALNRYCFVWAEPHAQVRRVNELLDGPMVIPAARLSLKSKVYAILKRHPEGLTVEQLADLLPPGGRATDEPPASVARLADVLRALESAVSYLKVARSG